MQQNLGSNRYELLFEGNIIAVGLPESGTERQKSTRSASLKASTQEGPT